MKPRTIISYEDPSLPLYFCITVIGLEKWCLEEIACAIPILDSFLTPGVVLLHTHADPTIFQHFKTIERFGRVLYLVDDFPHTKPLNYLDNIILTEDLLSSAHCQWENIASRYSETMQNPTVSAKISERLFKESRCLNLTSPTYRVLCRRRNCSSKAPKLADQVEYCGQIPGEANYKTPDMEYFVDIFKNNLVIGLTLFADVHKRYVNGFYQGKTCLNSALGSLIARIAQIKAGEIVWDPMCGSGNLLFQSYAHSKNACFIASDIVEDLPEKCSGNAKLLNMNIDCFAHDAATSCFREESVDVILSDLPFGIRHSSHRKNRDLYPRMLRNFRLALRSGGRAYLLTGEANIMRRYLQGNKQWKPIFDDFSINVDVSGATCSLWALQKVDSRSTKV